MRKPERRNRRSEKAHLALNMFLESLREREGIEALAVTTADGFLVAGVGETDVEWMGALGASAQRSTIRWEERTLHVDRVEVNKVPMFLTSSGKRASAATVQVGFERILAA
jgi:predicted regulator of Ras-like GTPase activity (Roadblock/LC7/MglB family)